MITLLAQLTSAPLEKPCAEPWDAMTGDDKVRRCDRCARDVLSLSAMTAREAELRLLNAGAGTPCIRYARDASGRVVHRAPPITPPPGRLLLVASALGVTLAPAVVMAAPKAQCVAFAPAEYAARVPSAAPPSAAAPVAAAPAAPVAAAPPPMIDPPMGGAPPPPEQPAVFGTLKVRSKTPRRITIEAISLDAPIDAYRLTPGDFVIEVHEGKRIRRIKVRIKRDVLTTIDLDAR